MRQGGHHPRKTVVLPRLRRGRRLAWLAALLLILNALSPALAASLSDPGPTAAAGLQLAVDDPLSGRLVICTPTGLRVITLDGAAAVPDSGGGEAYDTFCPFCPPLSSVGSAALPVLAGELPEPAGPPPVLRQRDQQERRRPAETDRLTHAPRGPPSAV